MSDEQPTGRARGGKARAEAMTPEDRQAQASAAATARWKDVPNAICGSPDRPLKIAGRNSSATS